MDKKKLSLHITYIHIDIDFNFFADGDSIKALESRQGDKQAREFLKKQRQKMPGKQFFSLG